MKQEISRRHFLKAAATVGAALTIQPVVNKVKAANVALGDANASPVIKNGMPYRTLGTGRAALEVFALGFGPLVIMLSSTETEYKHTYSPDFA